jgi:outer membrane protein
VRATAGRRCSPGALLLALLLIPAGVFAQTAAGTKVGYVDMKRLIDDAPQMTESRARLQREFAPRDAKFKDDDTKLAAMKQHYDRDNAIMSKSDAEAMKREIDALERSIKRGREETRAEFDARAAAERDRIWRMMNDAVVDYARANGFDLIVPSPVVYANPRIDITDPVLDTLRRAKPAGGDRP